MNSTDSSIYSTLKEVFGFDQFREGQAEVVSKILEGKSALAVFPTGSGKSLCYQLSALLLPGLTLVVSPLIALMKDQIDFLRKRKIPAARLDSTMNFETTRRTELDLRAGRLKLLYVAPERFSNERFIQKISRLQISLMVIDEAHCISEWGHNFRPDYLKLSRFSRGLKISRVLALTATATAAVAKDICGEFRIGDDAFIHTGFYRPNLTLEVTPCRSGEQSQLLLNRLKSRPKGPAIVYVTLQRTAEIVAEELSRNGVHARAYHAGLDSDDRNQVQDWFMQSADATVVATIAFGMGIDKADIRYVYHYNLPKSLENYSQEIGRSGRDGNPSTCEMFASGDDVTVLENFVYADSPDPLSIDRVVDRILAGGPAFDVSTYELSRTFDMRPLVVETLLTYLELADIIEATEPFYNEYHFIVLRPIKQILTRFDAERAEFVRGIFASAARGPKWMSVDLDRTAHQLRTKRSRVVKAMTYLEERGDLQLRVAELRQGYRRTNHAVDPEILKSRMVERFRTRERNDVGRVRQVVRLAEHSGCLVRYLLQHFGEELGRDCGHCRNCQGSSGGKIQIGRETKAPRLGPRVAALRNEYAEALSSTRQLARFLCGLSSPLLVQKKLTRHPDFGSLGDVPFNAVLQAADQLIER